MFAAEDGVGRASRGYDDVGAIAGGIKIVELDGLAVEFLRQSNGARNLSGINRMSNPCSKG